MTDLDAKPDTLLQVRNLKKQFAPHGSMLTGRGGKIRAVDGISLTVGAGETLGLVGESGSGKSTLGRALLQLDPPTSGSVRFRGTELVGLSERKMRPYRRHMQMIFQDPYASLNPRMTIEQIVSEPLIVHRLAKTAEDRRKRVAELLDIVHLPNSAMKRYPREFSGGQRQRVGIARALAVQPDLIVADEAVSALDVSIQAQIVNLFAELRAQFNIALIFIAHDLAVVRQIADRVAVMYLGKLMETADCDQLYREPLHPYTRALIDAAPIPDPVVEAARQRTVLGGEVPSPSAPPPGCVFHTRCAIAVDGCRRDVPALRELRPGHAVACTEVG
ncbi:MAG: ATP-binding cassette domain-containing protein [Alphaproteobacteria bacterium]|nr:ATP-binding cassette domain-containing protein [Alphaproteobacteria bacterium]